ncbi:DNA-binding protein [Burkholderia guangdongensis]|uniref:DNA-binding protein n=1 Tax=Burkholderia guangdongensis TaxID=1792500 RepID=UPI0015CC2258|nr:DNA-binding protein [Burkholderia guangdongensis]
MAAVPNQIDAQFQAFLSKLLNQPQPVWGEKQQMELDMARDLSIEMTKLAERLRENAADVASTLLLLRYSKVLEFIMSSLAAQREINPRTLRTIFKLTRIKVDDAYPD